jgi:hypothetical protein
MCYLRLEQIIGFCVHLASRCSWISIYRLMLGPTGVTKREREPDTTHEPGVVASWFKPRLKNCLITLRPLNLTETVLHTKCYMAYYLVFFNCCCCCESVRTAFNTNHIKCVLHVAVQLFFSQGISLRKIFGELISTFAYDVTKGVRRCCQVLTKDEFC